MDMETILPPELRDLLDGELEPGEKLLWSCQPKPSAYAWQNWQRVLFGIPFAGFAVFWMCSAGITRFKPGDSWSFFPFFGLPFLLVGLGMVLSPLRLAKLAGRTVYAITDRRAIILQNGWSKKVQSYLPSQLGNIERRERTDGWGDIIFAKESGADGSGSANGYQRAIGFLGIPAVKDAEAIMRNLAQGARQE